MLLVFSWQWCGCECCHSSSLRIFVNSSTSYKTTPRGIIPANIHHSIGKRPWQDYIHRVMLMTVLVLTGVWCVSTWLSHHFETVTLCFDYKAQSWFSKTLDTDRRLFYSILYFNSLFLFLQFSIFHLIIWVIMSFPINVEHNWKQLCVLSGLVLLGIIVIGVVVAKRWR